MTPDTYFAVDLLYQKQHSGTTWNGAAAGYAFGSATTVAEQDNWSARFRVHRDFYP